MNLVPPLADLGGMDLAGYRGGPWAWPGTLPVAGHHAAPMGEGNTPNILVSGEDGRQLWIKDESRNPTGSHKDRAMTVGVAKAIEDGASTVVAASSGNAGAAAAAYAARAGLRCVVLTTPAIPAALACQITAFGAALVACQDAAARDAVLAAAVAELGWYPLTSYTAPGGGGNPYAIEGYKSIAYELARDLGAGIGAVVVPTSRADLLAGIERGFRELACAGLLTRVPRLIAAETATAAAFSAALRHSERSVQEQTIVADRPSPAFSIGSTVAAWQGLHALWATAGEATAVTVEDYMAEHQRLPAASGVFLEVSSAVAVAAARRLLGAADAGSVVAIGTATGLKAACEGPGPAALPPGLQALAGYCERWFAGHRDGGVA